MGGGQGDLSCKALDCNVDWMVQMLICMLAKTGAVENMCGELERFDIFATDTLELN